MTNFIDYSSGIASKLIWTALKMYIAPSVYRPSTKLCFPVGTCKVTNNKSPSNRKQSSPGPIYFLWSKFRLVKIFYRSRWSYNDGHGQVLRLGVLAMFCRVLHLSPCDMKYFSYLFNKPSFKIWCVLLLSAALCLNVWNVKVATRPTRKFTDVNAVKDKSPHDIKFKGHRKMSVMIFTGSPICTLM